MREWSGMKRAWFNLRHCLKIFLKGLSKTTKNLTQDSRSVDRDLKTRPPKDESELHAYARLIAFKGDKLVQWQPKIPHSTNSAVNLTKCRWPGHWKVCLPAPKPRFLSVAPVNLIRSATSSSLRVSPIVTNFVAHHLNRTPPAPKTQCVQLLNWDLPFPNLLNTLKPASILHLGVS